LIVTLLGSNKVRPFCLKRHGVFIGPKQGLEDSGKGDPLKSKLINTLLLFGLVGCTGLLGQATDTITEPRKTFVEHAFSPGMLAKFSLGVLYDQTTVQEPEWGAGAAGLRQRAEWRMAGLLSRAATEYAIARMRETNSDYQRCRCKGFGPRSRHALVSEFVEIRADRSMAPPVARFTGIATSLAVTTPFLGQHSGVGTGTDRAAVLVGADLGFNMLQEFWPEIKRTLLLRRK